MNVGHATVILLGGDAAKQPSLGGTIASVIVARLRYNGANQRYNPLKDNGCEMPR
jgi:hypothetical protein